jgi:hypothetical protein
LVEPVTQERDRKLRSEHLDRDIAIVDPGATLVHVRHAALAQEALHLVVLGKGLLDGSELDGHRATSRAATTENMWPDGEVG